ncbi:hypothetical protein SVA_2047 [Sulfurifustis variabilis]|uniref:Glycosyltransferase RgtA/B/C/D-like domain-containing protein n=1 Tax=Sulfurifustis variabilis TaxID=1675686 RepID=A0A1B4V4Y4_9GAMM|nr:hypothetical protein [Sulfurifustis variabilis]BAU48599.1 hypothetical protein SVA_2047 [Sulfurifustis variabilis]
MSTGLTSELLLAATAVGALGFFLIARQVSTAVAIPIAIVKVGIPLVYFAWFFDGSWTFFDDLSYQAHGEELRRDYSPLSALVEDGGRAKLTELAQGRHVLYAWWNLLSQSLLGEHYYSPVFLNVLLTFVIGAVLFRIFGELGFPEGYRRGAVVFFLLHWDLLVWSSLVNLKEVLVMALIVPTVYFLLIIRNRVRLLPVLGAAAGLFVLTWVRYYVPFFLVGAFVVWMLLEAQFRRKYLYAALAGAAFLLLPLDWSALQYIQPAAVMSGIFRAPLTPQPWSIEDEYSFLLIPSVLHWLLFVPMVIGAIALWARAAGARFNLLVLTLMLLFYAIVPELQGPRHRVQLTFIIAWIQFHFFWEMTALALRNHSSLRSAAR